jgi:2'-5' RNA ligase superfamily protein
MPTGQLESAIVVRIALPPALERLRHRSTQVAAWGVPAHVTILYPFVPPALLSPSIRDAVARMASAEDRFTVRFEHVRRWPGVVWLAPEPAAPFARLTAAARAAFPGYPPYAGTIDEPTPHLSIAEGDAIDAEAAAVHAAANPHLPFERTISAVTVIAQEPSGRWRVKWRLSLRR